MTASAPPRCFDLEFAVDRGGRTFLGGQFVRYPVHICRGLHVDEQAPEACAVTLQSVSGGLFESDLVAGRIRAQAGAQVLVNTSASTIVHAMRQAGAEQAVELQAHQGAFLQYLPEPLILFPGSRLRSTTTVQVARGATALFCESFLAHDPSSTAKTFASLDTRIDVLDPDGRLLVRDRMVLSGERWQARTPGVSSRYPVHGSVWLIQPEEDQTAALASIRAVLEDGTAYAGASRLPHRAGLHVRILGLDAVSVRRALRRVAAQVRSPELAR
ncbi:urease accessory protein UreD [Aquabacterium sp.]|uniref:urease accessory protein UreD n=1 Tax=Aquabacterium sp. TaxID=1872578 RepID=UPI003D6D974D